MIGPGGSLPPLADIGLRQVRFTFVVDRGIVVVHSRAELDLAWSHLAIPLPILEAAVTEIRSGLCRGQLGMTAAHGPLVAHAKDAR